MLQWPVGVCTAFPSLGGGTLGSWAPGHSLSRGPACGKALGLFWHILAVLLECVAHLPQLIAWEPEQEEEVTMVTARPNFQDSIHVGFVSGLKKFTEYFTSVLCFTTPGDGPRSTPQLVRTHEDGRWHPVPAPSAPTHPRARQDSPGLVFWAGAPPARGHHGLSGPWCSLSGSNWHWAGWGALLGYSARARGTPELQ